MFRRKFLMAGFGLALLSEVSCSRPLCDVNHNDERCLELADGGSSGVPTLEQKRLHYKTGGQLDFAGLDANAIIVFEQNGIQATIGQSPLKVENGAFSIAVIPPAGFKPGRSSISITQNSKTTEYTVWLYANAKFQKSTEFLLANADGRPNWASVNNKTLYVMHDYMSSFRHVIVRSYDSISDNLIRPAQQPWDVELPSYAKAALTKQGMLQLRQHSATTDRVFVGCFLETQTCIQNNQITAPANTTYMDTDFTADYNELFYAFIDGSKNLNVWSMASRLPTGTVVNLDSKVDSITPVTQLATGDFDGDNKGDLLVWQWSTTNAKASLFLGQQDGTLKYDSNRSMQIQQQIGSSQLTSLAVGDLDVDGLADIVYSSGGVVQIVINQGDSFKKTTTITLPSTTVSPDIVSVGDLGGMSIEGLSVNDITFIAKKTPGEFVSFTNIPN